MENNKKNFPLKKSKRLFTLKKKAMELSVLCNIDVCLVGTHQDPADMSATWHTWPEDQNEVVRVLNKYKKRVEPQGFSKREISEFDVDKALEGMSFEELNRVFNRANEVEADVDQKLDLLLREQNSGAHAPMVSENQTMEEAISDEIHVEVANKGPKIFGVFLTPATEVQSSSGSPQSTETEV